MLNRLFYKKHIDANENIKLTHIPKITPNENFDILLLMSEI